jgi:uncharacterized membrane protein
MPGYQYAADGNPRAVHAYPSRYGGSSNQRRPNECSPNGSGSYRNTYSSPNPVSAPPYWALSSIYALHLLATVVWVGGLASLALLLGPSARRVLDQGTYAVMLGQMQRRLQALGWFSLLVLTVTGLFQMSANPNYKGFLAIANPWAVAILLKHLTFGGMILVSGYVTWGLYPALHRTSLQQAAGREVGAQLARLHRQERWALWANLALAVLILAFTALARAA